MACPAMKRSGRCATGRIDSTELDWFTRPRAAGPPFPLRPWGVGANFCAKLFFQQGRSSIGDPPKTGGRMHRSFQALPALDEVASALDVAVPRGTRLYELYGSGAVGRLLVESWVAREALSDLFEFRINTLSTDAHLPLGDMLGQRATLHIALADGRRATRSGIVMQAGALQSDGGLARYQLVVRPWLAALQGHRRSQSFIDKSVIEIVGAVFQAHCGIAAWTGSDELARFVSRVPPRHYCNQFAETDYDFVRRILCEEGVGWCFEEDDQAPHAHRLRLFADSTRFPEDPTSASGGGLRFQRADGQEPWDAVQHFALWHQLAAACLTLTAWDHARKSGQAASVPTLGRIGGVQAPRIESYDPGGRVDHHNGATRFASEHYGRRLLESYEARRCRSLGTSTVRSLRPGCSFTLRHAPLSEGETQRYVATAVRHAGINNLPRELGEHIARRLGAARLSSAAIALPERVRAQAEASGYANEFECVPASRPWRPVLLDETGARINPRPTVAGAQSAIVVGPEGQTHANGADGIYTDRLGRIKVRFHWQSQARHAESSDHSIWVRAMQRYAGAGMGTQFIPRIGQEVVVIFEESDIDRPLVVGAVYNGKGEGGVPATPGGAMVETDTRVFTRSTDHLPSGQADLAAGNSPAWHGLAAAEDQQCNAAALSGVKTREFGGEGHNCLVFDDSDAQLRVQAGNTQHASWLSLGHLLHQADNHRGSFRGAGFELRTDAYGGIRGGRGLLLTTCATRTATPAGDNAAGMALAKQAQQLARAYSDAARMHETVQQACHLGAAQPGASLANHRAAPLKALHTVLGGTVAGQGYDEAVADAAARNHRTGSEQLPQMTDPAVAVTAKAGLGVVAGQALQTAAGEGIHLGSGRDTQMAIGAQARLHAGQAIGVLAGAVKAGGGAAGSGLTVIAAQGDIDMQAQAGRMDMAARQQMDVKSRNGHIDWAAARKITLATSGGASITIDGGGIVTQCPGKMTVHASRKSFQGPSTSEYFLPPMPKADFRRKNDFPYSL
ncbi:type VI secretion system tip protein VgrG [Aquabacterium sp. A7-Y]|uniref:type VI secretion system Vgr family protein n=1 Tax=Aquabacterium sp. A7-Y TaxID=1349605 RepID=UPI00223CE257|nr:type VI secretion system Vgr family protein [Aquabacterium sp. A7-Y]MCW7538914.1 type VI secretion system tip protein VgrG [Aquabacterium sp. A7-Y]